VSDRASHRLDGLEHDNLLAFLALLGLLRALEAHDRRHQELNRLCPRAAWDIDMPPLRPRVFLTRTVTQEELAASVADGLERLAELHEFDGRKDLNYSRTDCRELLRQEAAAASVQQRGQVDLLGALMSDGATKPDKKEEIIDPTPLCLLYGQGHQHFLERLAAVPNQAAPAVKGKGKKGLSTVECLSQALFHPWHREDDTSSFRWDPEEDVRYALMAGDPTDPAYKAGTQHGANRLAAVGLAVLTLAPERRAGRVRPNIVGGGFDSEGFSFAWPIWREPATLSAIRAMLAHPELRQNSALAHMSVDHVVLARRISVGKFMNFSRARRLATIG